MKRELEKISSPKMKKRKLSARCVWTTNEDELLFRLATLYGFKRWNLVAEKLSSIYPPKSAKQCRERWHTRLNPDIKKSAWSPEEERKLLSAHKLMGNKWASIAETLPGRTDNGIKNYFFCKLRKLARNIKNLVLDLKEFTEKEDCDQFAYLLHYLYTYYLSPAHDENTVKSTLCNTRIQNNLGDKYIKKMIADDTTSLYCFHKYIKFFLSSLQPDFVKSILHDYPEFIPFSLSEATDFKDIPMEVPLNVTIPTSSNSLFN